MHGRKVFAVLGCASLGVALNCGGSVARSDADEGLEDGSSSEGSDSSGDQSSSVGSTGKSSASGSGQSSASGSGQSSASGSGTGTSSGAGGSGAGGDGAVTTVTTGVGQGGVGVSVVTGGFPLTSGFGVAAVTSTTGVGTTGAIWPGEAPIPEECSPTSAFADPYSCFLELSCDGRFAYSNCWYNGNSFGCECGTSLAWNNFQLWDVPVEQACNYAASLCLAEPQPEFTPGECQPTFMEAGNGYCSSQLQCTEATTYEGVRVTRDEWNLISCSDNMGQGTRCDCQFNNGFLSFDLLETPVSAALCSDLVAGCSGDLIERKGGATCTRAFQSASQPYCNAQLDCTQDALLDGHSAILHQQVPVTCYQNESGTWGCQCPPVGSFEVSDETAWDACTSASAECASGF